ncbi:MAG: Ig-like domain repeat protein [Hyphomicrobiaceae bacterium]|nr:Ig-like domain repeat protein [Hyphomicrobiaceae bacterium]
MRNTGGGTLNWSASGPSWLTLSPSSGSLAAGASQTVTATVNASANALSPNTYAGAISFSSNGGPATRTATLAVTKAQTTTTITSDAPDPSVFGEHYPVSVNVLPVAPAAGTPTGTVTVSDDLGNSCPVTLSGGAGSCSLPSTQVGTRTLTASYPGDVNFTASSDTESHAIGQGATTTTITSDGPDPSVFGEPYPVSVNVLPVAPAAGTPTGTVTIADDVGNSCPVTLSGGAGSCSLPSTHVGTRTLTASYVGDVSFTGSSGTADHIVGKGATTTTITGISPNPSVFGEPYTVAVDVAPVAPAAGTPGGAVTISDDLGNNCTATLAAGSASCALPSAQVGPRTITASYGGDTSFAGSTGTAVHGIDQGTTTTTITDDSPDPSVFGEAYTVSVMVAPSGSAVGTPTGTVTIEDDVGNSCPVTLSGGAGSCNLPSTHVGSRTLTASYIGDANFTASADTESHAIGQGATTTTITSDAPDPSVFGQPYNVSVQVTPDGAAAGTPTGSITVSDGSNTCTTPALSGAGIASCAINGTPVGAAMLTATYAGDANFTGSSGTEPHTVDQITTTVSVTASVNPSLEGQSVTFTASVSPAAASGTVTFKDGAAVIGTGTLAGGAASISVSTLSAGPHSITAVYNGDTNHATSASPVLVHTVTPNGSIILAVAASEGDGTFSFTSPTPALTTSLMTSGGSGQASAASLNPGTYTVMVGLPTGFGLTSVTCSDGDSTGSTATRSATIVLAPAETVTCTFSSVNSRKKTVEVISHFMSRRADMLLSNGPDPNRQVDRLLEAGGGSGASGAGFAEGGGLGSPSALGGPSRFANSAAGTAGSPFGGFSGTNQFTGNGRRSIEERIGELGLGSSLPDETPPGLSPVTVTGSNDGPMRMSFATSLAQVMRYNAEIEKRRSTGELGSGANLAPDALARPRAVASPFDIWAEGHYRVFSDDRDRQDADGHFGVVYLGADYVVTPWLLIGALVQYDSMEESSRKDNYRIEGHGWMAGPYATVRLSDEIFLQGRAAWGTSSNTVSPFLTYSDDFDSERWLVSSTLVGRWEFGRWQLRPNATLAYIEDVSSAYTDSLGVPIPGVKVSLGQLKAGPEVSYRFSFADGTEIEPHLGLHAIWNFASSDEAADFGGTLTGPEELRGRIELGLRAAFQGGVAVDFSGSYDGIGSETFHSTGGRITVRVPLN